MCKKTFCQDEEKKKEEEEEENGGWEGYLCTISH